MERYVHGTKEAGLRSSRGDPVLVKSTVDDLRAVNFRDLVLLRSADMGSLAFVFGYCGLGYPVPR